MSQEEFLGTNRVDKANIFQLNEGESHTIEIPPYTSKDTIIQSILAKAFAHRLVDSDDIESFSEALRVQVDALNLRGVSVITFCFKENDDNKVYVDIRLGGDSSTTVS